MRGDHLGAKQTGKTPGPQRQGGQGISDDYCSHRFFAVSAVPVRTGPIASDFGIRHLPDSMTPDNDVLPRVPLTVYFCSLEKPTCATRSR